MSYIYQNPDILTTIFVSPVLMFLEQEIFLRTVMRFLKSIIAKGTYLEYNNFSYPITYYKCDKVSVMFQTLLLYFKCLYMVHLVVTASVDVMAPGRAGPLAGTVMTIKCDIILFLLLFLSFNTFAMIRSYYSKWPQKSHKLWHHFHSCTSSHPHIRSHSQSWLDHITNNCTDLCGSGN